MKAVGRLLCAGFCISVLLQYVQIFFSFAQIDSLQANLYNLLVGFLSSFECFFTILASSFLGFSWGSDKMRSRPDLRVIMLHELKLIHFAAEASRSPAPALTRNLLSKGQRAVLARISSSESRSETGSCSNDVARRSSTD